MKPINVFVKDVKFHKSNELFALASVIANKNKNFEDLTKNFVNLPYPIDVEKIFENIIDKKNYLSEQSRGLEDVRKLISIYENKTYKLKYDPHREIILMPNGKFLFDIVCRTILNKDDEVIVGVPYNHYYVNIISINGGIPIKVLTDVKNEYKLTADDIKKHITKKTKAVVLNPFVPSMSFYTKEELKEIADVCRKNGIYIISDEINDFSVIDGKYISIGNIDGIKSFSIIIKSFENKIPLKDFTFGYILAYKDIANQINKIAVNTYESIDLLSQYIVMEFLKKSEYFDFVKEKNNQKMKLFVDSMKNNKYFYLDYLPKSNACIMLNCKNLLKGKGFKNSSDLSEYLMRQKKYMIGTLPSVLFGIENYIILYLNSIEGSKISNICQRLYGMKEKNED